MSVDYRAPKPEAPRDQKMPRLPLRVGQGPGPVGYAVGSLGGRSSGG